MPSDAFLLQDGKEYGPFSSSQLKQLAAAGKIGPDDLIKKGPDGLSVAARRIAGLAEAFVTGDKQPSVPHSTHAEWLNEVLSEDEKPVQDSPLPPRVDNPRASGLLDAAQGREDPSWLTTERVPPGFDPYHVWLGIPKGKRPPTHYQLLRIASGEHADEVIEAAAERLSEYVRKCRIGEYATLADQVLYEIEEAKLCLLNPRLRREYDEKLSEDKPAQTKKRVVPPPAAPIGEANEIVRTYLGIVSIILVAFIIMAVVTFFLPWDKVVFSKTDATPDAADAVAPAQPLAVPIAPGPGAVPRAEIRKIKARKAKAPQPNAAPKAVAAKPKAPAPNPRNDNGGLVNNAAASQKEFEQSVVGKYRLELTVDSGESDKSNTLDLHGDKSVTFSDGHRGKWEIKGGRLVVTLPGYDIDSSGRQADGTFEGEATETSSGRKAHYKLTKTEAEPVPSHEKVDAGIVEHQINVWNKSKENYASYSDLSFDVGMGNRPDGFGFAHAGVRLRDVRWIDLEVTMSKNFRRRDLNSFAGFIVDYHTPAGYTSRVELGTGFSSSKRWAGSPWWGKGSKPDRFIDLGRRKEYAVDLLKWAPSDWDGETWFSANLQNSGPNTAFQARITRITDMSGSPLSLSGN